MLNNVCVSSCLSVYCVFVLEVTDPLPPYLSLQSKGSLGK